MEEENKKARRVARREYNDALRELTVFVKKRDKRVAKVGASWALGCLFACSRASADVCVCELTPFVERRDMRVAEVGLQLGAVLPVCTQVRKQQRACVRELVLFM